MKAIGNRAGTEDRKLRIAMPAGNRPTAKMIMSMPVVECARRRFQRAARAPKLRPAIRTAP